MKRWQIKHCRDNLVIPGFKWDVWQTDTDDTFAEPVWMGYGSYEVCLNYVVGLAQLRDMTGIRGG